MYFSVYCEEPACVNCSFQHTGMRLVLGGEETGTGGVEREETTVFVDAVRECIDVEVA